MNTVRRNDQPKQRRPYSAPQLVALDVNEAKEKLAQAASEGNLDAARMLTKLPKAPGEVPMASRPTLDIKVRFPHEAHEAEISLSADHLTVSELELVAECLRATEAALRRLEGLPAGSS